jgi:putative oxidoreductase
MGLMHQMDEWSSKHHPKWLVVLRVVLGLCLFLKGFDFIQNSVELTGFFSATSYFSKATWLNTAIPWIHLLGGSMIIVGLFTRLWSLVQIPILLGAILFVNTKTEIAAGESSNLMFPIIILILLVFFFVEGGGPISLDYYFKNYKKINREN